MIDQRRIRIGVEILGELHLYEDLHIRVSGTKYASPLKNECSVIINGLNARTRNFLMTETSPFNANRTPKRLTVEVGRESTGLFLIFVGDIIAADVGTAPDVEMTIRAKTNSANMGKIVTFSAGPMARLSVIAQQVAANNDLRLEFQATDKNIANYSFSGAASRQVARLAEAGGVRAYVDDRSLYVTDGDLPVAGRRRILNANSGMVGIPQPTEKGIQVSYLIDGESDLGGQLTVESRMNEALNGDYIINQLKFDASNHDDAFFYTALCSRLNS